MGHDRLKTTAVGSLVTGVIIDEENIYYNVLISNSIPAILPKDQLDGIAAIDNGKNSPFAIGNVTSCVVLERN